ncbi:MAG: hypothetical protein IK104_04320 [Clostridia bacterium]|nr:hypothetical protein [Clostridia bacterium]
MKHVLKLLALCLAALMVIAFAGAAFAAGTATVSVDASLAGLGYLVAPTKAELVDGETAASTLLRVLRDAGFAAYYSGSPDGGFYLAYLGDGDGPNSYNGYTASLPETPRSLPRGASFAPEVAEYLTQNALYFEPDDYPGDDNMLGEFTFTDGAGWMYALNGVYPAAALSSFSLADGDALALRFTLLTGRDLKGEVVFGETEKTTAEEPTEPPTTQPPQTTAAPTTEPPTVTVTEPATEPDETEPDASTGPAPGEAAGDAATEPDEPSAEAPETAVAAAEARTGETGRTAPRSFFLIFGIAALALAVLAAAGACAYRIIRKRKEER